MKTLKEYVDSGEMLIAAHRGASGLAPENTIPAFQIAIEQGANMIETDLQFTDDGYIVAFHDRGHLTSNNTTGNKLNTLENLKKLDAGSWFDEKFKDERIPLLEEVLEFAKGKAYLNLELKSDERHVSKKELKNMVRIVREFGMEHHLMFCSFDYSILKKIKVIDPELHVAALRITGDNTIPSEYAKKSGIEAFICSINEINDEINEDSIKNNIFLAIYSVDTELQLNQMLKYNISAIGTNYPGRIKELLAKMKRRQKG